MKHPLNEAKNRGPRFLASFKGCFILALLLLTSKQPLARLCCYIAVAVQGVPPSRGQLFVYILQDWLDTQYFNYGEDSPIFERGAIKIIITLQLGKLG